MRSAGLWVRLKPGPTNVYTSELWNKSWISFDVASPRRGQVRGRASTLLEQRHVMTQAGPFVGPHVRGAGRGHLLYDLRVVDPARPHLQRDEQPGRLDLDDREPSLRLDRVVEAAIDGDGVAQVVLHPSQHRSGRLVSRVPDSTMVMSTAALAAVSRIASRQRDRAQQDHDVSDAGEKESVPGLRLATSFTIRTASALMGSGPSRSARSGRPGSRDATNRRPHPRRVS